MMPLDAIIQTYRPILCSIIVICLGIYVFIEWRSASRFGQRGKKYVYDKWELLRHFESLKKMAPSTLAIPPKCISNLKVVDADSTPSFLYRNRVPQPKQNDTRRRIDNRQDYSYNRGPNRMIHEDFYHRDKDDRARNFNDPQFDSQHKMCLESLLNYVAFKGAKSTLFPNGYDVLQDPNASQTEKSNCMKVANREALLVLKAAKMHKKTEVALDVYARLAEASVQIAHETFTAMVETCLECGDLREASNFLMNMESQGHSPNQELLDKVMDLYSKRRMLRDSPKRKAPLPVAAKPPPPITQTQMRTVNVQEVKETKVGTETTPDVQINNESQKVKEIKVDEEKKITEKEEEPKNEENKPEEQSNIVKDKDTNKITKEPEEKILDKETTPPIEKSKTKLNPKAAEFKPQSVLNIPAPPPGLPPSKKADVYSQRPAMPISKNSVVPFHNIQYSHDNWPNMQYPSKQNYARPPTSNVNVPQQTTPWRGWDKLDRIYTPIPNTGPLLFNFPPPSAASLENKEKSVYKAKSNPKVIEPISEKQSESVCKSDASNEKSSMSKDDRSFPEDNKQNKDSKFLYYAEKGGYNNSKNYAGHTGATVLKYVPKQMLTAEVPIDYSMARAKKSVSSAEGPTYMAYFPKEAILQPASTGATRFVYKKKEPTEEDKKDTIEETNEAESSVEAVCSPATAPKVLNDTME